MLPRMPYPVTEYAVLAIEAGLEKTGLSQADLARELDVTPQAINRILRLRENAGNCEFLADALRAVGQSEFLALPGLNEAALLTIRHFHAASEAGIDPQISAKLHAAWLRAHLELAPQDERSLADEIIHAIDREIAYRSKT